MKLSFVIVISCYFHHMLVTKQTVVILHQVNNCKTEACGSHSLLLFFNIKRPPFCSRCKLKSFHVYQIIFKIIKNTKLKNSEKCFAVLYSKSLLSCSMTEMAIYIRGYAVTRIYHMMPMEAAQEVLKCTIN